MLLMIVIVRINIIKINNDSKILNTDHSTQKLRIAPTSTTIYYC